jgi:hypothetical protein
MSSKVFDLDQPVWGAADIALAIGLKTKRGKPRTRAVYHLLESGRIPASKVGKTWVSTPRRLRSVANGEVAT